MNDAMKAYVGADIHDEKVLHSDKMLVRFEDGSTRIENISDTTCPIEQLDGGTIAQGFVDLQVNGGGGVMFNDAPSVETLKQMSQAHRSLGVAAFLPTLITDTPAKTIAAIEAVHQAIEQRVSGVIGLHLEGPHLSVARKGAHDARLIRRMEADDLQTLVRAAEVLPNLMVTLAPESVELTQIKRLRDAGVIVFLGHTNADFETCMAAFDAGVVGATHLYNAMSQMAHRAPGLVGAVLARDDVFAGLIADGQHVHPAAVKVALRAKKDRIFLVSDAMAVAGSQMTEFELGGRKVLRREGRLTLTDGTLAGADLKLLQAVKIATESGGDTLEVALARTRFIPSKILRDTSELGQNLLYLSDDLTQMRWL